MTKMSHSRFAESLEWIEDDGWLSRIEDPIDPDDPFEIIAAETCGRDIALLSNITGRRFPMAGQLMPDEERISKFIALEGMSHLADFVEKLVRQAAEENIPLAEAVLPATSESSAPLSSVLGSPNLVKQPACQKVVRHAGDLDATVLPSLRVDREEEVQKITAATLFTVEPDSGRQLAAGVDLVVEEKKVSGTFCAKHPSGHSGKRYLTPFSLVPQWKVEDQLDAVRAEYAQRKEPMPVAILLGGVPLIRLVAEAPKPAPIDPILICASLWKQKMEVTPCRTLPELTISADADMVIEGHWIPADDVIEIQALTHRINPIVPFAWPDEQATIRRILLEGLLPWWRAEVPGLADLVLPRWADDGTVLVGSVEKAYAKETQRIADTLAEHPVWHGVRLVILLDETVNLSDESAVLAALTQNAAFDRKTLIAVETL